MVLWAQHEGNIRLSSNAAESFHTHEISIFSAAHVIFWVTYSFMWCSKRKMKSTSAWVERLLKALKYMKSQYLFGCTCDFQNNLQLHVALYVQNKNKICLSWKAAGTSHMHETTIFSRLHMWFLKELTTFGGVLGAKGRGYPSELKGLRNLSYAWNHHICSTT